MGKRSKSKKWTNTLPDKRRAYDKRYQKQPNYAGKNLRQGKITEQEVERFVNLDKRELFVQCWKCLSVMHVQERATRAICRYCGGFVEVLTINGVPVKCRRGKLKYP